MSFSMPMGPLLPQQLEPMGQAGGAPMSASKRTQSQSAESKTPLKPLPLKPPLFVKIVTVWPMCLNMLSERQQRFELSMK
jgi:hypothetical protein